MLLKGLVFRAKNLRNRKAKIKTLFLAPFNWMVLIVGVAIVIALSGLAIYFCKPKQESNFTPGKGQT